jgi:hypothetical protein
MQREWERPCHDRPAFETRPILPGRIRDSFKKNPPERAIIWFLLEMLYSLAMMKTRLAAAVMSFVALTMPALAIKGGRDVTDPSGVRSHVVQITGPSGTKCSGTVISRKLVLTAAHCFLSGHGDYRIRALDTQFRFRFAEATQVAIHPQFDVTALGTSAAINDIALIRVDHDFPDWLVPVPLASRIADDGSFVDVQVAGFGMSRDRVVSSAGKLRERRFDMLDQIDSKSHQLFLIDHKATRRTINNNGICRGDSGGPVFQRQGASYVLVGVISAVMGGKGRDCGTITAVTAVSAYRSFIETMADRAGSPVRFQ